jgi:hypothetical protein
VDIANAVVSWEDEVLTKCGNGSTNAVDIIVFLECVDVRRNPKQRNWAFEGPVAVTIEAYSIRCETTARNTLPLTARLFNSEGGIWSIISLLVGTRKGGTILGNVIAMHRHWDEASARLPCGRSHPEEGKGQ